MIYNIKKDLYNRILLYKFCCIVYNFIQKKNLFGKSILLLLKLYCLRLFLLLLLTKILIANKKYYY